MRNLSENKYAQRLIQERIDYNRIIISCDFDDTISPWKLNTKEDCEKVFKLLRLCKEIGCYVVIFTACTEDRYIEIRNYCEQNNLKIDAINKNPIDLPYGNQTKIYYNHCLDDRAGLEEACEILEFAAYTMLAKKHSPSIQTVEF